MLLSLESAVVGAFVVPFARAMRAFRQGQGRIGRPGSEYRGIRGTRPARTRGMGSEAPSNHTIGVPRAEMLAFELG